MQHTKTFWAAALGGLTLALIPARALIFAQTPADMAGLALVGHNVSDLERSIQFFEAIDFKVVEGPSAWKVDRDSNKLFNILFSGGTRAAFRRGAESRTAVMHVQSSVSDVPF